MWHVKRDSNPRPTAYGANFQIRTEILDPKRAYVFPIKTKLTKAVVLSNWTIDAYKMERMTGIEPAQPAWKAGILPLNYIRKYKH